MSSCPRLGCRGWVPCTNRQGALLTGMTVGFDHRAKTSQWKFLEKVHKSFANILHLNQKLKANKRPPYVRWHSPHTLLPQTQCGADHNPPFLGFPFVLQPPRGLNEHGQASYLGTLLALLGPHTWRHVCPPGGSQSPPPPTLHRGLDFHGGMKSGETYSRRRERSPWKARGGMHWRAL